MKFVIQCLCACSLMVVAHSGVAQESTNPDPVPKSSAFQYYCSDIEFILDDNNPTVQATCLKDDGKFTSSRLTLANIGNVNGVLTEVDGDSTFQQSCGNIQIQIDGPYVSLTAICFNSANQPISTSYDLNGIINSNGQLSQ